MVLVQRRSLIRIMVMFRDRYRRALARTRSTLRLVSRENCMLSLLDVDISFLIH